jgi:hypothetical protein
MNDAILRPALICLLATATASANPTPDPCIDDCGCGLELTPHDIAMMLARQDAGVYNPVLGPRADYCVPVTLHVVRRSNGTGGLSNSRLDQAMDDLNIAYVDAGITFYVQGAVDYIDDDDFYFNIDTTDEINLLRQTNVVPDTINIYFTENLARNGNSICGTSSFTTSPVQGIVIKNSCAGTSSNPSTFPHEVGHYFDLFHTHETAFGDECVDGSNCAFAGDLLCDTPADPRLTGNVSTSCLYIGDDFDPCQGVPYEPDTSNVMSYSRKTCRTFFSPLQNDRMVATLVNVRPELISDHCGCAGDLDGDGDTDLSDLGALLAAFELNDGGDLDNDGDTDLSDLGILLADWECGV